MKLLSKAKTALETNIAAVCSSKKATDNNIIPDQPKWEEDFITMSLAYFHPEKAMQLFENSLAGQWENGFLPQHTTKDVINQTEHLQNYLVRLPLQGFLLWQIYDLLEDKKKGKAFLKKNYTKVLAFHRYLYDYRDPQEEGIVYIRHPWESGMENAPIWDSLLQSIDLHKLREAQTKDQDELGPFAIQDPFFNALLTWSNESLIKIGGILKEDILEIIQWHELSIYSINDKLWDEERGIYNAYDLKAEQLIPVSSISGILPMVGEVPTQDQAEGLLNTLESAMFGGKLSDNYLCPTNSLNSATMSFPTKWRGAISMLSNWMLVQGLKRYDMDEMAEKVQTDMLELFSKSGFFEYYDVRKMGFSPRGYGKKDDPVSAAICIDLLMREVGVLMV